ncbi:hypothetical protein [Paramicrobacterium fandaimingii]|nr:hypothetical protein [Microbacterium fandaimingii]
MTSNTESTSAAAHNARFRWTGEKTAWWIVFGATTLGIILMLGLWN